MSLPITAVGPLNVETNPILMVSAAEAGCASARTAAPASQKAVLIVRSLLTKYVAIGPMTCPAQGAAERSVPGVFVIGDVFCARNRRSAASMNRPAPP